MPAKNTRCPAQIATTRVSLTPAQLAHILDTIQEINERLNGLNERVTLLEAEAGLESVELEAVAA